MGAAIGPRLEMAEGGQVAARRISWLLGLSFPRVSGNDYRAPATMERLGLEGKGDTVRVGLVHYNTAGETDRSFDELEALVKSGKL